MKKKLLALLLTGCLVLPLFAFSSCLGRGTSGAQAGSGLRRLKSILLEFEDEEVSYEYTWDNGGCSVTTVATDGSKNNDRFTFDGETGTLYCEGKALLFPDDGTHSVLQYGEGQKISHMFTGGEDYHAGGVTVVYDGNKLTLKGLSSDGKESGDNTEYEFDPATKTMKRLVGTGYVGGPSKSYEYEIFTLDDHGNVLKQELFTYEDTDGDGSFEKVTKDEDHEVLYEYDKNGNLLKIWVPNNPSFVYTFEYYNKPIEQTWETAVPYLLLFGGFGFDFIAFRGMFDQ